MKYNGAGKYIVMFTRFISISGDFDSNRSKGDTVGMDVAFKYLISECYSRDMPVKTKSANGIGPKILKKLW